MKELILIVIVSLYIYSGYSMEKDIVRNCSENGEKALVFSNKVLSCTVIEPTYIMEK